MFADTLLEKSNGLVRARDTNGKRFAIKRREWTGTEFSTDGGKTFREGCAETIALIRVTCSKSWGWWIHNRLNVCMSHGGHK